ncbi:hypothetical protein K438DRAFT_1875662 [Mycena galopus ATCC 62051]|nr:hypothetical protein K438DRAFT_1875662 [Mycena galopus ATCC 62051]
MGRTGGGHDKFVEEARFAGAHELGMALRWGLSRVVRVEGGHEVRGLLSWAWYERWRAEESGECFFLSLLRSFLALRWPPASVFDGDFRLGLGRNLVFAASLRSGGRFSSRLARAFFAVILSYLNHFACPLTHLPTLSGDLALSSCLLYCLCISASLRLSPLVFLPLCFVPSPAAATIFVSAFLDSDASACAYLVGCADFALACLPIAGRFFGLGMFLPSFFLVCVLSIFGICFLNPASASFAAPFRRGDMRCLRCAEISVSFSFCLYPMTISFPWVA